MGRSSRPLFGSLYGGIDYCWCVLPHGLNSSTMALAHTCPVFWNAHRTSWSIPLVFISRRMMPVGALLWGRHPWAASQRPENVCHYRCFVAVGRQLLRAMASTLLVSLMLREKTARNIVPRRGLYGQRRVPRGFLVRPHSATDSIRKGFVSQLNLPMKHGQEWDLVRRIANPSLSPRANSCLTMCPSR